MDKFSTRYSDLSNSEVNELYRSETWSRLTREEKLDALQELENRAAEGLGNKPCEVSLEQMNGAQKGYYQDGKIFINESLVEKGELRVQYDDGTTDTYQLLSANAELMDTIHHENFHGYQMESIDGRVEHNNADEVELWSANKDSYIGSELELPTYRIQPLEKSAYAHAEAQTKAAFGEIEAKYGVDKGFQEYLKDIKEDTFENALAEAQELYGVDNIENALNEKMLKDYRESLAKSASNEVAVASGSADSTSNEAAAISSSADSTSNEAAAISSSADSTSNGANAISGSEDSASNEAAATSGSADTENSSSTLEDAPLEQIADDNEDSL